MVLQQLLLLRGSLPLPPLLLLCWPASCCSYAACSTCTNPASCVVR
jgi:hypothetical protein